MENEVLTGKTCPYCGKSTDFIDSSYVYKKSYGMIYICKPCGAYVGTHKGTDRALGRLADWELRTAKKKAHFYFDKISRTGLINKIWTDFLPCTKNREKAYIWLSKQMKLEREFCHIGMFSVEQCNQAIHICKNNSQYKGLYGVGIDQSANTLCEI